ncbi:MAG: hypothetical protein JNL83_15140, partial [Myxococcales bacterium]|nr:hypothetical protein [Myxococcales bacterium]
MRRLALIGLAIVAACGGQESRPADPGVPQRKTAAAELVAKLPSAPGVHGPSLVAMNGTNGSGVTDGEMLSDVDSCATCHPDAAAQWSTSAHSFASFGNPIYRVNVELMRHDLGDKTSQHCGGCHDMPLMADGMMTNGQAIPPADLRSHSGVTCRLCHGIQSTTKDGNGSYVWNRTPIEAPALNDPASIARHKVQVGVKSQGTELCV